MGSGSTFTVQLPIEQSTAAKSADNASGTAVTQGPGRRVLIADDNVDSAESLAVLLRLQGHQVEVVHDGAAALRRLEESRPQFALLDIGMPNLNGYEVARRTRAQPWSASITLIALTGWGQEQDRRDALEAGFDHHLLKPVDTDRLAQTLVA